MTDGNLVFLETAHGTRYWRVTDEPATYGDEMFYCAGLFEDVEGAISDGLIDPDVWSNDGDIEAALGHETYLVDEYREHLAQLEQEKDAMEEWRRDQGWEQESY